MATGASGGVCFGFEPKSSLDLGLLRGGTGIPLLVRERDLAGDPERPSGEPLLEWQVPGVEPLHTRLHGSDGRYDLWIEGGGWFGVDTDTPAIDVPATGDPVRREERLWGLPSLLCFRARGDFALHAAAVEIDGGAVLLGAPGRYGKTTLAAGFLAAGHRVLTEDLSCCQLGPSTTLLPGPALLKVRKDAYAQLDLADAEVLAEDRERVHLTTGLERRGDGGPVPVRGILLLGGQPEDDIAFEPVDPVDAVQDLWVLAFNLPTDADRARCFADLVTLTRSVPVWRFRRPFTYAALPRVVDAVRRFFGA